MRRFIAQLEVLQYLQDNKLLTLKECFNDYSWCFGSAGCVPELPAGALHYSPVASVGAPLPRSTPGRGKDDQPDTEHVLFFVIVLLFLET